MKPREGERGQGGRDGGRRWPLLEPGDIGYSLAGFLTMVSTPQEEQQYS